MPGASATRPFLTAQWRYLAMLNYAVDPALLAGRVPPGTELDSFEGRAFVSLVAFQFLQTRVLDVHIPFHENFEEVNLRFYVRRRANGEWRRGVVFVKELVPRPAIALVARQVFNENYVAVPMSHHIEDAGTESNRCVSVAYHWRFRNTPGTIELRAQGAPQKLVTGSLQQFITEHYWGYALDRAGRTLEYEVRHEPWCVWAVNEAAFSGNAAATFGAELARALDGPADSSFLADGSPVAVYRAATVAERIRRS